MSEGLAAKRLRRFWSEWLRPLLVVALVLFSFRSAVADWNDVPSGSMEPTLLVGDRIFVNRLAYDLKIPFSTWHVARWGDPARGDVVILESPVDGTRLVKRVVGVPGDVIEVRAERLLVNGVPAGYGPELPARLERLPGDAIPVGAVARETVAGRSHAVMAETFDGPKSDVGPLRVPPGKYFLMGDHRDTSFDSRFWGFAERRAILGRVVGVVLSLDYDHHLSPRWQRFFSSLDS